MRVAYNKKTSYNGNHLIRIPFQKANGDKIKPCPVQNDTLITAGRTWVRSLPHLLVIAFYGAGMFVRGDEGNRGR